MAEEASEERPARNAAKLAWAAYYHVAAVLGAFSMAVLLGELFDIGWRGFLARLVGVWSENVRPVVGQLVDWIVWPFEWAFDWSFAVPLVVVDYLAVGLILAGSNVRAAWRRIKAQRGLQLAPINHATYPDAGVGFDYVYPIFSDGWERFRYTLTKSLFFRAIPKVVRHIVIWPIDSLIFAANGYLYYRNYRRARQLSSIEYPEETPDRLRVFAIESVYSVLPLLYLGILLATNYFFL